ncbi:MAG: hypothetical protein M3179_09965 [Actinomycetota bacterium]|nr:hypothetical protein [Actinomycetota bacterium]
MLLRSGDGNELELSIVGYQFPHSERDPWESNSLLVSVRLVTPEGTWEVVDPCLTTWEAAQLAGWLAVAARLAPGLAPLPFVQPNLTVSPRRATAEALRLRACFELERRPPWGRTRGRGPLCVDLDVDRAQLAEAAGALAAQLAEFPMRGDDPTL